jgi:hypothetical protein
MEPTSFPAFQSADHFRQTFKRDRVDTPAPFQSPDEELAFLRAELAKKEAELTQKNIDHTRESLAQNLIQEYKKTPIEHVVDQKAHIPVAEHEAIALKLRPESHDTIIEGIINILLEKGIRNALETLSKMKSPHLDDDFERFLVQYLSSYHAIPGLKNDSETYKNIDTTLFEVTFPTADPGKTYKDTITLMEQFYASMQVIGPGNNEKNNYFSLEIAQSNESQHVIFYVSVPNAFADLFQRQLLGLFQHAQISIITDDYNIFNSDGFSAASYAVPTNTDIMTIKTYDTFDHDPINLLLGIFDKMEKNGEGASVQLITKPVGDKYTKDYGKILDRLRKGESIKNIKESLQTDFASDLKGWGKAIWGVVGGNEKKSDSKPDDKKIDDIAIGNVTKKLQSTIVETTIRIIASAATQSRADEILRDLESAFLQYQEVQSNGITFKRPRGEELSLMFRDFSYRRMDPKKVFHLNFKELATMFHFPTANTGSAQLKESGAATHPAPMSMGTNGILLGYNNHRGKMTPIHFNPADRLRHYYTIGQTGVGKTQMFLKMIIQDIKNGDGCCFIDPHGSDINTILANIPPERFDDVVSLAEIEVLVQLIS